MDYIRSKEMMQYQGNKVVCTVCGSSFNSFAPVYAGLRPSNQNKVATEKNTNTNELKSVVINDTSRCPNCGSLERHRLLWEYLHKKTSLFDSQKKLLLEFAPVDIFFDLFSSKLQISYFPCDIKPGHPKYYKVTDKIIQADITKLQFSDNFFDVVLCSHVLEHVIDDRKAMSEMYRVMKKGAWAIIQVPLDHSREFTYEDFSITSFEGREQAFGLGDHVRIYGKDLTKRLASAGFKVTEVDYVSTFSREEITRYGFDPYEILYLCEKV